MANLTVSFDLPESKVDEYVAYYIYVHKNKETILDPEWIDPEDGSVAPKIAKYTDKQWVKEHIIRIVRNQIKRGRNIKYRDDMEFYNVNDIR